MPTLAVIIALSWALGALMHWWPRLPARWRAAKSATRRSTIRAHGRTLIIVTSLALGTALGGTGAAAFLAHSALLAASGLPPALVISGLLLATALLTEVVTNNAIAVIATPIAMSIASELALPAIPFVLAVLFGANMSYLTPIGYQTNLLVMSAGGYRFSDFFRAGLPLQLLMWLALSFILPATYL